MNDRHAELARRAAELKAVSAALVMVSEELAGRLAKRRQAGSRAVEQPGAPGADSAGDVPVTWPGAGVLDEDEAVALAGLLEELAARHSLDPLSGSALQAAALLRRRVAAGWQRSIRLRQGGPVARREAGDSRDDDAGHRDSQAGRRDLIASDRDDQAKERDLQADAADEQARAGDQRIYDLLWDAELRGRAAVERAAASALVGGDAGADRSRDGEDREAIREMLGQARVARQAARHDRYAAGQDRVAAARDRGSAQADRRAADRDRRTARADRDQAVIESEEEDPPLRD